MVIETPELNLLMGLLLHIMYLLCLSDVCGWFCLMKWCCVDDGAVSRRTTKKHDVSDLYAGVRHHHQCNKDAAAAGLYVNVQHDCLRPRLRDYQKAAVLWMLTKEHFQSHSVAYQSDG